MDKIAILGATVLVAFVLGGCGNINSPNTNASSDDADSTSEYYNDASEENTFQDDLENQFTDISDPDISINDLNDATIDLKVNNGFHASPEPNVYAYYTLLCIKRTQGWDKYQSIVMHITAYYDESPENETTKIWKISTKKLSEINLSDKELDSNNDGSLDTDEIRNFSAKLPNLMDSIQ